MEIVEAGAPPAPGVDLADLVRFDFSDLGGDNEQFEEVAGGGYFLAHQVEARCAGVAPVAAQAGKVAVPEDAIWNAITRLERNDSTQDERFAAADGLRAFAAPSPAKESK